MRIVNDLKDVKEQFERASSEALKAFGNGSMFIERYITNPRHIEIQIMGDQVAKNIFFPLGLPKMFPCCRKCIEDMETFFGDTM